MEEGNGKKWKTLTYLRQETKEDKRSNGTDKRK